MLKIFFLFNLAVYSLFFLFSSCSVKRDLIYLQDVESIKDSISVAHEVRFKPGDLISVLVSSDNAELSLAFNFPANLIQSAGGGQTGYTVGRPQFSGYLVSQDGYLDLPVVGRVFVLNKSREELVNELQIIYKDYLDNPKVLLFILNYKITILGDVVQPGTYQVPNERISLLEAIGLAGDLRITGNRKNVLIMREENGINVAYRVDLTSPIFLTSPLYYLQQNDVVYVEPGVVSRTQATLWKSSGPVLISITSFLISTILIFTR
jgi:polysaccharide export outer membrane protein